MTSRSRYRSLVILRGSLEQTAHAAHAYLREVTPDLQLWVSGLLEDPIDQDVHRVKPHEVRTLLGRAFDAVVLEAHSKWNADVIGQSHGLVWGGGALVIRLDAGALQG